MSKIRMGVIGPGIIWERAHEPALKKLKDKFEIAAFCARSEQSKNKVKEKYPGVPFYKDYRVMVREPFIDAVIIMTPILLNPVVAAAALEAGKDVFLEKPVATNVNDGKALIKKEKESGKRIFILEQYVYKNYADEIKKVIDSGILGDVLMFDRLYHAYIGYKEGDRLNYGNTQWRMKAEYPLGMLLDGGIHEIAVLTKIFGKPRSVFAAGVKYRENSYGNYDYESMIFEYKDNLIGTFCNSYYLNGNRNYFIVRGTQGLVFYKEDSIITVEKNDGKRELVKVKSEDLHQRMWSDFVNCLENNLKPYYTSERAIYDLEILEAVNKSLKEGKKVTVE